MNEESSKVKRKRGRPKLSGSTDKEQTDEIIDVAVRLFVKQGYNSTTMSQIARAAGYNQSSLYYWFKKKEELLEAILKNSSTALGLASSLALLPGDKLVQLYAVIYVNVKMMCESPFDFYDLEIVAHSQDEFLQNFFTTYQQFADSVEQIIQQGIESNEFDAVDTLLKTMDILALCEGLQHRYQVNRRLPHSSNRMLGDDAQLLFASTKDLASHAASVTILSLAPHSVPAEMHRQAIFSNWIA